MQKKNRIEWNRIRMKIMLNELKVKTIVVGR